MYFVKNRGGKGTFFIFPREEPEKTHKMGWSTGRREERGMACDP
jgi:hypothetical protein